MLLRNHAELREVARQCLRHFLKLAENTRNIVYLDFVQDDYVARAEFLSAIQLNHDLDDLKQRLYRFLTVLSATPSPGTVRLWEHLHRSWSEYYNTTLSSALAATPPELTATEWTAVTTGICALGSEVFALGSRSPDQAGDFVLQVLQLATGEPGPKVTAAMQVALCNALAHHLHPNFAPALFDAVNKRLQESLKSAGQAVHGARHAHLLRSALLIVRHHLEQHIAAKFEHMAALDVFEVLSNLLSLLNLATGPPDQLRDCRALYCATLSCIVAHREHLKFSKEMTFRNQLLDTVIAWVRVNFDEHSARQHALENAKLSLACLTALVGVLHNLPLLASDGDGEKAKVGSRVAAVLALLLTALQVDSKCKRYQVYFTFFMGAVNKLSTFVKAAAELDASQPVKSGEHAAQSSHIMHSSQLASRLCFL